MSLLSLEGVKITYGNAVAVKSLDLHVDEGEFVSLIGHNGVGKSSTVKAIAGVVKPAAGRILYEGQEIAGQDPGSILRRGIAVVPEGRRIFTRLTVRENLIVGGTIRGDRGGVIKSCDEMMERFPILGRYSSRMAGLLSGGEQQQLAIARALMSNPKLILLDEPSLGLAPQIVEQVFDLLAELQAHGSSILLVEQNAVQAIRASDRYYLMRTGGMIETQAQGGVHADATRIEAEYLNFGKV
jgi:branched-chain amino acid transport system ATP-binding protein